MPWAYASILAVAVGAKTVQSCPSSRMVVTFMTGRPSCICTR